MSEDGKLIEQGLTSHQTHYRSYRGRMVKEFPFANRRLRGLRERPEPPQ